MDQVTDGRICSPGREPPPAASLFLFPISADFCSSWRKCLIHRIFLRPLSAPVPSAPDGEGCSDLVAKDLNSSMSGRGGRPPGAKQPTFQLYVITRRNTTWQGFLDWLDGTPRQELPAYWSSSKCG